MEEAPQRPNVELRVASSGEPVVVFAFPYDAALVLAMRAIPGRRFDWVEREWSAPQHEATAVYVADVLARWPALVADEAVLAWLGASPLRWLGRATTRKRDGRGEFVVRTVAGEMPDAIASVAGERPREGGAVIAFSAGAAPPRAARCPPPLLRRGARRAARGARRPARRPRHRLRDEAAGRPRPAG